MKGAIMISSNITLFPRVDPAVWPTLVCFVGYAGSGKDTAARALLKTHLSMAFADPIKKMLIEGLMIEPILVYGGPGIDRSAPIPWLGKSPRYLMQTLGTQWGRNLVGDRLWVKVMERRIAMAKQAGQMVVITDGRMENELEMVRNLGGLVIHIRRGRKEGWWRAIRRKLFAHASERGVRTLPGDEVVENAGTVEDLHVAVLAACKRFTDRVQYP